MRIKKNVPQKRKQTFVLVIPRFEDIFHSYYAGEIIRGVTLSASRLNVDILIHITDRSNHEGWLDSSLLDLQYVQGIIFADIDNDLEIVQRALRAGMPCMVLNNVLAEPINYIAINNYQAAFDAVRYLISLGHKRIATIAGDPSTQSGLARLEGYRAALKEHRLDVPRSYVTNGQFLRTPAREAALKLLKLENRPTAIFVASDVMALEAVDAAKSLNVSIPQELSIIGFDDNPVNLTSSVPLTTIAQPLMEMGRLGAEQLGRVIQGQERLPVKMILPTKFLKRESTASAGIKQPRDKK